MELTGNTEKLFHRLAAAVFCLCLVVILSACGDRKNNEESRQQAVSTVTQPSDETVSIEDNISVASGTHGTSVEMQTEETNSVTQKADGKDTDNTSKETRETVTSEQNTSEEVVSGIVLPDIEI